MSVRRLVGRNAVGAVAAAGLLAIAAVAVGASHLSPYGVNEGDVARRLLPPGSPGHPLGTDALGRDVFTRLLYGARTSLLVGAVSVAGAGLLGTVLGLLAGYLGGPLDRVLGRIVDTQLSFPFVVLALTMAALLGPSLENVIVTLVVSSWVIYARLVRGEVLVQREREYVVAALAMGATPLRVVFRHILPHVLPTVVVTASLEMGRLMLTEAAISFLGYGIQPPQPSWGKMVAEGKDYLYSAWWLPTIPGLAIIVTTLCTNLVGDWLRDLLDARAGSA